MLHVQVTTCMEIQMANYTTEATRSSETVTL